MKTITILILLLVTLLGKAQVTDVPDSITVSEDIYREASTESKAYSKYRHVVTQPSYSLAKIKKIVKKIQQGKDDDYKVTKKIWDAFTTKEKFTYCLIHQESYSQNCDAEPPVQDEQKKIFAYIPDTEYEQDLSNRQIEFLKKNKDSVIAWIKETATAKKRVGLNLKEAVIVANLKDAIPFLIQFFNKTKKDGDILTTLILLMENAKYKPQVQSQMHEKLYGPEAAWPRFVNFSKANTDLIIKRAMDFYNAK